MKIIQKIGLGIFVASLLVFVLSLSMSNYQLTSESLEKSITNPVHLELLQPELQPILDKEYTSKFSFINDFITAFNKVNNELKANEDWDNVIWTDYTFLVVKNSSKGLLLDNLWLLFIISFVMSSLGALMYILPQINDGPAGIKNH